MYKYEEYRHIVFEEENQKTFLVIRDHVHKLLETNKYIDMQQAISGTSGSNFEKMAMVDRLVELGELYEVKNTGSLRLFMKA
jgi:hypothetical protein